MNRTTSRRKSKAFDSGTGDCPISYTSYPGESAILNGARVVGDWAAHEGPILRCPFPQGRSLKFQLRQLFLNGRRQRRARQPDFGPDDPLYGGWAFVEEVIPPFPCHSSSPLTFFSFGKIWRNFPGNQWEDAGNLGKRKDHK